MEQQPLDLKATTERTHIFMFGTLILSIIIMFMSWKNGSVIAASSCAEKVKLTNLNQITLMLGVAGVTASVASYLCFIRCSYVGHSVSRYAMMSLVMSVIIAALNGWIINLIDTSCGATVDSVKSNAWIVLAISIVLIGGSGYLVYGSR